MLDYNKNRERINELYKLRLSIPEIDEDIMFVEELKQLSYNTELSIRNAMEKEFDGQLLSDTERLAVKQYVSRDSIYLNTNEYGIPDPIDGYIYLRSYIEKPCVFTQDEIDFIYKTYDGIIKDEKENKYQYKI